MKCRLCVRARAHTHTHTHTYTHTTNTQHTHTPLYLLTSQRKAMTNQSISEFLLGLLTGILVGVVYKDKR